MFGVSAPSCPIHGLDPCDGSHARCSLEAYLYAHPESTPRLRPAPCWAVDEERCVMVVVWDDGVPAEALYYAMPGPRRGRASPVDRLGQWSPE